MSGEITLSPRSSKTKKSRESKGGPILKKPKTRGAVDSMKKVDTIKVRDQK